MTNSGCFLLEDRTEVPLFRDPAIAEGPRWTPDGKGIVFLSDQRELGKTRDLWMLHIAGGKSQGRPELVKGNMGNADPAGTITRDGTYYYHQETGMIQVLATEFDPVTGKAVGDPVPITRQTLGQSRNPSVSRDGRWLSYLRVNSKSLQTSELLQTLVIHSVESGEERDIPMDPGKGDLKWSVMFPDGRSVLVNALHPKDGWVFYRVDAASGASTLLKKTSTPEERDWPNAISPDGRTVYYNRDKSGRPPTRLMAWDIETGQERELLNGEGLFALSHDGKQVAVARTDGKDQVIDVLPAAGGPKREVYRVTGARAPGSFAWTPDGQHLIFVLKALKDAAVLMRIPVEGGEAQPIGISAQPNGQVQFPRTSEP